MSRRARRGYHLYLTLKQECIPRMQTFIFDVWACTSYPQPLSPHCLIPCAVQGTNGGNELLMKKRNVSTAFNNQFLDEFEISGSNVSSMNTRFAVVSSDNPFNIELREVKSSNSFVSSGNLIGAARYHNTETQTSKVLLPDGC